MIVEVSVKVSFLINYLGRGVSLMKCNDQNYMQKKNCWAEAIREDRRWNRTCYKLLNLTQALSSPVHVIASLFWTHVARTHAEARVPGGQHNQPFDPSVWKAAGTVSFHLAHVSSEHAEKRATWRENHLPLKLGPRVTSKFSNMAGAKLGRTEGTHFLLTISEKIHSDIALCHWSQTAGY